MTTSDIIARRVTTKVLADPERPRPTPDGSERPLLRSMMEAGHRAPHHFPCHESHRVEGSTSPVPWRFYALDGAACRALRTLVAGIEGSIETTMKLLGGTDGLIVVTWLPEPRTAPDVPAEGSLFDGTRRNMEHVAAASAAVQNMLLVATEEGRGSFWSSGGPILLSDTVRELLGIPAGEVVLAAVYLAPDDTSGVDTRPGARRPQAGAVDDCTRWIGL